MFDLQKFEFNQLPVTVIIDKKTGEILFDASHVCEVLGYSRNAGNVLERLDDDEKRLVTKEEQKGVTPEVTPLGGFQDKYFVFEPGLYKLIFGSQKEQAKAFTRFVAHEILPSIRKTGGYGKGAGKELDMARVHKTFTNTKKLAKENGMPEIPARLKAAEIVKQMHQVDIFELLGIDPPVVVDVISTSSTLDRIVAWARRKGLSLLKPRDLHRSGVPGCVPTTKAKAQMQALVGNGLAEWVESGKVLRII